MATKELKLRDYLTANRATLQGKPEAVLQAIDDYPEFFMNVGPNKGKILRDTILADKPGIALELGGYIGYSAVLFSSALPPNGKYYSFEANPEFAAIAQNTIDIAGLSDKVEIVVGKADETLPKFAESIKVQGKKVGFIFIDHRKDLYLGDLRLLESTGLVSEGIAVTADNIYFPGAPDYLKYVQSSPEEKKKLLETEPEVASSKYPGRWDIDYDTKLHEVKSSRGHMDAITISRVRGYATA